MGLMGSYGRKPLLHKKTYTKTTANGPFSISVVSAFGIPEKLAKTLGNDNFAVRLGSVSVFQNNNYRDMPLVYTWSYNPGTMTLTMGWTANNTTYEAYPNVVYVDLFWAD